MKLYEYLQEGDATLKIIVKTLLDNGIDCEVDVKNPKDGIKNPYVLDSSTNEDKDIVKLLKFVATHLSGCKKIQHGSEGVFGYTVTPLGEVDGVFTYRHKIRITSA